jgi:glycosyltransferase involved in cell wall biosynthesis
MNILHTVEFYAPSTGGSQEAVRQLSERMAAQGHRVTVATTTLAERTSRSLNGVAIEEFRIAGNRVRGMSGEIDRYQRFLLESDFDVVMNYAAQEWAADLFFEVMDGVRGKKVLVPCGYSGLYDPAYADYFGAMPAVLKKYDASVYLSETYRDLTFARAHGIDNLHVIPNGAGADEFGDAAASSTDAFRRAHGVQGLLVLTVGNHTGQKGHAEAMRAIGRARVAGATTLMIVGGGPGGCETRCRRQASWINARSWLTGKRVVVADVARSEVRQAFMAADIFLFLSNIEASPIVLFEAVASGTPFIASPVGNSAEVAGWTGAGLITRAEAMDDGTVRPDVESAARLVERLAADHTTRREMSSVGRAKWRERFTWERIAQDYLDLYEGLLH